MVELSTLIPRSAIRREISREDRLYSRYQRTETTMTSARKWRPLKSWSRLDRLLILPEFQPPGRWHPQTLHQNREKNCSAAKTIANAMERPAARAILSSTH